MLDYLRNLRKSEEDQRQELLTAYVDGALSPKQRQQVERDLAQDEDLLAEVEQMRLLQQAMRQLPQRRVRRSFTLDPALYGRPQREPLVRAYPILRTATALAAFLFIFLLAADIFLSGLGMSAAPAPAAMEMASEAAVVEETTGQTQEAPLMMEVAPMEEEAESPAPVPQLEVESDLAASAEVAEGAFQELDQEAGQTLPEEEAPLREFAVPESSVDESSLKVQPTMIAEGTFTAGEAAEQAAAATALPAESAALPPVGALDEANQVEDVAQSAPARQVAVQAERGPITAYVLELLTLLLGIVFILLVIITLLARRRL